MFFFSSSRLVLSLADKTSNFLFMRKYNRIKAVLADKGKTAKWLAKEVGRDPSTVSRWCTNDMQPLVEVLFQVAELLEVDVCDLLVRDQRNDATP